jgi:hypothetical protein
MTPSKDTEFVPEQISMLLISMYEDHLDLFWK